jgi:hypothetical protein
MTPEQMEQAIEFLLDHHAKFSADIDQLKELQSQTSADVRDLAGAVSELSEIVGTQNQEMREGFARLEAQAESDRQEIREAINNLILANEVTRKFAQDIAQLAASTSQRVTNLESQS